MLPQFHTLYFETTRLCNLSCPFCSTGSNGKYEGAIDMTYNEIVERVLHPAYKLGTRLIQFSGGEFLLRKDAFALLKKANDMGFKIAIASNSTTLSEPVIISLKELLDDNIFISLGVNAFTLANKDTRDIEYEGVTRVISLLEKHNMGINLCITLGKFNSDTVAESFKAIRDLKLPFNRIPYVPRNCNNAEFLMDKEVMKKHFFPALLNDYHGYVSYTPFFLPPEYYEKISGQNESNSIVPTNPSIGCWCGAFYSINPEGEVSPCALLSDHFSGGNVLKQDLHDILLNSELFKKIVDRKNFGGKCGRCKFKFTCGGCRAMAYYINNDLYGEDPTCFIDELEENELNAIIKTTEKNFKNFARMAQIGKTYFPPDGNDVLK